MKIFFSFRWFVFSPYTNTQIIPSWIRWMLRVLNSIEPAYKHWNQRENKEKQKWENRIESESDLVVFLRFFTAKLWGRKWKEENTLKVFSMLCFCFHFSCCFHFSPFKTTSSSLFHHYYKCMLLFFHNQTWNKQQKKTLWK